MAIIRLGVPADLPAASDVYRSASLSNAGDRDNLLAHPEYLILGPEGLAEGRTYVAEEEGSLVGFATWVEAGGVFELEDLFVDPGWRRTSRLPTDRAAPSNRCCSERTYRGLEKSTETGGRIQQWQRAAGGSSPE